MLVLSILDAMSAEYHCLGLLLDCLPSRLVCLSWLWHCIFSTLIIRAILNLHLKPDLVFQHVHASS